MVGGCLEAGLKENGTMLRMLSSSASKCNCRLLYKECSNTN